MNQIRYFSLLGLFILLCYAAPASLWVDSLKGQTLFEKLSGLSKRVCPLRESTHKEAGAAIVCRMSI